MYKTNWPYFTEKMITDVSTVLRSGKVNQWTGSKVFDFEKKFSTYFGVKHSVAVFNGSVALELCLRAIGIQPYDEVMVTPRSFIASASCINLCGGVPIFVDVDECSQNITLATIKQGFTLKTKAVILVHLGGWPCDLEDIIEWCHSKGIYVIEDCAQAHGAKYKNKYVGTWGDINAWSFCQDKIMTTGGEGGMVTTNNRDLFLKAWSYKDHGKNYEKFFGETSETKSTPGIFKWVHDSIGTNFRMTEIQAAIGLTSLDLLEEWVTTRRINASIFNELLKDCLLVRLTIPDEKFYHSYYKYYCFIRPSNLKKGCSRNDIIIELNNMGIPCFQGTCGEIYKEMAYNMDLDLPTTKLLSHTSLMFMVDPSFEPEKIKKIAHSVKQVLDTYTMIH